MEKTEAQAEWGGARRWLGPTIAAALLALPILYVLSAGPAVYFQTRGIITMEPGSAIAIYFYPLQQAQLKNPRFMWFMASYGRMWRYNPPLASPPPAPAISPTGQQN